MQYATSARGLVDDVAAKIATISHQKSHTFKIPFQNHQNHTLTYDVSILHEYGKNKKNHLFSKLGQR
jgi:hypothetical protein